MFDSKSKIFKASGNVKPKKVLIMLTATMIVIQALFCANGDEADDKIFKDNFSATTWSNWKGDTAIGEFLQNPNEGHNSKGAMEISIGTACPSDASFCFLKRFPANPGKTYNAIVWVKAEGIMPDSSINLAFQGQDGEYKFLGTPVIGTKRLGSNIIEGWQRLILTFKVPNEGLWAKTGFLLCTLGVEKSSQGKVLFDDFEFFETK